MMEAAFGAPEREVALTVLREGPISRADVGRWTGLASPTVTKLVRRLVERGIVLEGEPRASEFGRPWVPLTIDDSRASCVGVKLVPGGAHVVVTGLAGRVHDSFAFPLDTSSPASTVVALVDHLDGLGAGAVGIALPAAVTADGTLHVTRMLGWPRGANLERDLQRALQVPCVSAKDVDGLTIHAHWFGGLHGLDDGVLITLGQGVGVGVIVDGRLLLGHQGAAAILGRLWTPEGDIFGDVLSIDALVADATTLVGRRVSLDELPSLPEARPAVERLVRTLGWFARASAIAYAPRRILLTGELIGLLGQGPEAIVDAITTDWRDDLDVPEVVVEPLEFTDFAKGAAALAIRRLFTGGG